MSGFICGWRDFPHFTFRKSSVLLCQTRENRKEPPHPVCSPGAVRTMKNSKLEFIGLLIAIIFIFLFSIFSCGDEDTTPPDTVITNMPANPSYSGEATFEFESSEESSTFECMLDGGEWESCEAPHTYEGLIDGGHTFSVRAVDQRGNLDLTPAVYGWTIDTASSELAEIDTNIIKAPDDPDDSSESIFRFACNKSECTFECRLDFIEWESCISPHTYSGLEDGNHTFEVRATDSEGNLDHTPAGFTWTIDTSDSTPLEPTVVFDYVPNEITNRDNAVFEFHCLDGECEYSCRLDFKGWSLCESPENCNDLEDGNHTFEVREEGRSVEEDAPPARYSWTIDTIPPQTTITSYPENPTVQTNATFGFVASESGSSFQCRLDSDAWYECESPETVTGLVVGDHLFEVYALDLAENPDDSPDSYPWVVTTSIP